MINGLGRNRVGHWLWLSEISRWV